MLRLVSVLMLASAATAAATGGSPASSVPGLSNAGRPMPAGGPRALIVLSPSLQPQALDKLVDALEAEGIDAWLLDAAIGGDGPDRIVAERIPAARTALAGAALVGYGLGGTLAARAALADPPAALAILGAPLEFPRSALSTWLVDQDVPADGLDLSRIGDARWHDQRVLPLLLGEPLPAMDRVSAAWLVGIQTWAQSGDPVDLRGVGFPVWAGVGDLDELAPPEVVRPWLSDEADLVRFGYLHLDGHPYRSTDLLADRHPSTVLARALADALR